MSFKRHTDIVSTDDSRRSFISSWYKAPSQATTIGIWFDMSMSSGNPIPQYYIGSIATSTALSQTENGGIPHGGAVSPLQKGLRRIMVMTSTATALPMRMILCDYLMFYPFIDQGTTDTQNMTNSITLPRYTDGAGVKIMVINTNTPIGGSTFQVSYTNQDGVSDRTTTTATLNTVSVTGSIVTSERAAAGSVGPFLALQDTDTGVRSVDSVTMLSSDVGLFSLVLVKPLAQFSLLGIDAPVEVDFYKDFGFTTPIIMDDAYLGIIACPSGALSATRIYGMIETSWT